MTLLAELPSWLSVGVARNTAVGLAIGATVLLLLAMFLMRSVALRVVSVVILGCAVFGLLHYHSTLDHCDKHGCACTLFGEKLQGGGCQQ